MNASQLEDDQMQNYKIVIVGKSSSGKTKLLIRYRFGTFTESGSITVGVDSHDVTHSNARFKYYDTAGQDRYKAIVDSYYRGSDACIIAYDISNQNTFQQIASYYNKIQQLVPDALIYIVGCKSDLKHQVSQQMVKKYYKGYHHQITSAKTNENIKEMFSSLQAELLKKKPKQPKIGKTNRLTKRNNQKTKKEGGCCSKS